MAQQSNSGRSWTRADDEELARLIRENTPTRVIALYLLRTELSIYQRAAHLGLSLKPVNQSPYNRLRSS